ncbi:hypothetical protein D3C71_1783360 [compost metagenome]
MRERGEYACSHQRAVVGRKHRRHIACDEDQHQAQQQLLARPVARQQGEHWRAHGHAKGVARNEGASRGNADAQVLADLGEQAHDDEFGGTDAKGAGGECQ